MALSRNFIVPLVVACALFMEQMDGAIIATALPRISQSLHTDPLHLNLAITSYMFSLAVFIPLSRLDRRPFRRAHRFSRRDRRLHPRLGRLRIVEQPVDSWSRPRSARHGRRDDGSGRQAGFVAHHIRKRLVDAMAWVTAPGT